MNMPALSVDFDRSSGIGASEAGAALGLSRFVSPYTLWARKTGIEPEGPEQTAAMEWGLRLQDPILAAYADRQGLTFGGEVRRNNVTRRYSAWPHLFATTDGYVFQTLITGDGANTRRAWCVDAKAPRSSEGWGADGSTEVPPDYYAQAQAQCLVTGLPRCDLAVLFHGSDFRVYPILADPARQAMLLDALKAFWVLVIEETPPAIDAPFASTDRTLARQFGGGSGDLAPTPELVALVHDVALAYLNKSQASKAYDLARQRVEAVMGEYDHLDAPDATITWSRTRATEVTSWDLVAQGYRVALDGALAALLATSPDTLVDYGDLHLTPEGIRAAVDAMPGLYTNAKQGSRRFLVRPRGSDDD